MWKRGFSSRDVEAKQEAESSKRFNGSKADAKATKNKPLPLPTK